MKKSPINQSDRTMDVFMGDDAVYRIVKKEAIPTITRLFESGLAAELMRENLIAKAEIKIDGASAREATIKQELISPIVYPFEWSPEMLRSAALCTLRINEIALKYGFELKDAQPYNIVFRHSNPLHVDLGSFVLKSKNAAWVAEKEFKDCYHSNLRLAEIGLDGIYKHAFLLNGNGMSGEQEFIASSIYRSLGWGTARKIKKFFALYNRALSGASIEQVQKYTKSKWIARLVLQLLRTVPFRSPSFDSAKHRRKIVNYDLNKNTLWGDYHCKSGYYDGSKINLPDRLEWVLSKIKELDIESVTEIAGNQGVLSRSISNIEGIKSVICTDYDAPAVDELFRQLQISREHVTAACFDFMRDVRESLTRERGARLESDMVIALAVTHHLILTQGYSLHSVLDALESYTHRYMIIEFMPLGLWSEGVAPPIPNWYNREWFEDALRDRYEILEVACTAINRITYLVSVK